MVLRYRDRKEEDMKTIVLVLIVILATPTFSFAGERVRSYWRDSDHDGTKDTYVQPYQRTSPDSSRTNNYSFPGNFNPNTGRMTPPSNSPRETYPVNPNPYERK